MDRITVYDFNLEYSLECGQAFRWAKVNDCYYGVIGESLVKLRQDDCNLFYKIYGDLTIEELYRYLAIDTDLGYILNSIDVDEYIRSAISIYRGLRILRQDPWECLASFILSSCNNIPRIKQMILNLSMKFGASIRTDDFVAFTFPAPSDIANAGLKSLESLRLGFRADYLLEAARKLVNGYISLDKIRSSDYSIAKSHLLTVTGIGDKVADCILLFSMEKYEAFPVDVWIERIMERLYFEGEPTNPRLIGSFAREHFGRFAGYAQEYLYRYARERLNQLTDLAEV